MERSDPSSWFRRRLPLIICGTLNIGYDLALLYLFRHIRPPEEAITPKRLGSG